MVLEQPEIKFGVSGLAEDGGKKLRVDTRNAKQISWHGEDL